MLFTHHFFKSNWNKQKLQQFVVKMHPQAIGTQQKGIKQYRTFFFGGGEEDKPKHICLYVYGYSCIFSEGLHYFIIHFVVDSGLQEQ